VDGVALQAAHHLGASRRRLPSHVSALLQFSSSSLPRAPRERGRGRELPCFVWPLPATAAVLAEFLRVRKGLCSGSTRAARDTRCCNSVRVERRPCTLVAFFSFIFRLLPKRSLW
jgi:hypothetical protein